MSRSPDPRIQAPIRRAFRELRRALLDLVLPPHCPGCGDGAESVAAGRPMCAGCEADLDLLPLDGCPRCGEPSRGAPGQPCGAEHRDLEGLAFAAAVCRYRGTGGALVRRLKLRGDFGALGFLAARMARGLAPRLRGSWRRALVVPVPLHRLRRRSRGFDQAELLAAALAERLQLVVAPVLQRHRATLPQGDPRTQSRDQNVRGAFAVRRARGLDGQRVVLVDDVATSGATARACAAALRASGVEAVALATVCRARSPT